MMNAYINGKDMYSEVASKVYKLPYEECLEHFPKGSKIKQKDGKWYYAKDDDFDKLADGVEDTYNDGKKRRKSVKGLFLGITYGMSVQGIADTLKISVDEARKFWNDFYKEFPKVKQYIEDMQEKARQYGFVETAWGRKRRLPEMQLPEYEFDFSNYTPKNIDVLDFDNCNNAEIEELEDYYWNRLINCRWYKQKEKIKQEAKQEGIIIKENGGKIADAERQCVNSIIQGSAADMTKIAMLKIGTNKRLKELDCKLAIQVHDEVVVDCPKENAEECAKIVTSLMVDAAKEKIEVPMKCDAEFMTSWKS